MHTQNSAEFRAPGALHADGGTWPADGRETYLSLLEQSPIAYAPQHAPGSPSTPWELYTPYGEILAYPTRREAIAARGSILRAILDAQAQGWRV